MPSVPLGSTPSSAVLSRFLEGIKPGTGILSRMPTELVEIIASHVDMPALGQLRLTCRELESKTLWHFTQMYFREIKYMPSKYALEVLVAMSQSRMAKYVKTLRLGTPSNDQGPISCASPLRTPQIVSAMMEYSEQNRTMRAMGEDVAMIKTAFQSLRGITKIEFVEPACACGCGGLVGAYGEHYLTEVVGEGVAQFAPIMLDPSQSVSRLLYVALSAAESAGLHLEHVNAQMSSFPDEYCDESRGTGFGAFPLHFPLAVPGENPSPFANLSTLKLFLAHHQDVCNPDRRMQLVQRLTSFLDRAPSLKMLSLTFQDQHGTESVLGEITSSPVLRKIPQLELCALRITSKVLTDALKPLRHTVRTLKLRNLYLQDNSWIEMLEWLRDSMVTLNEIDLCYLRGYPDSACYSGDSIKEFFEETLEIWEEQMEDWLEAGCSDSDVDFDGEWL